MTDVNKKIDIVVIVGPTASGKTSLSVELAKRFDGEIVSADSMQIYKYMDIATAKPTVSEQQGIKHHMMDFLEPEHSFSVAQYCESAHKVIKQIADNGKLPILVGGTGLYVDSLVNNIVFSDNSEDEHLRNELYKLYDEHGIEHLLNILSEFDPESATRLSEQVNVKRIIRAIEVYKTTGVTQTEHNKNSKKSPSPYNTVKIGLKANDRQFLYDRINRRVDCMMESGLLDEAQIFLSNQRGKTSSMAIGYKELAPYFEGVKELSECVENLKVQTRRYAKRQLTWFLRDDSIKWFNIDEISGDDIVSKSVDIIKKEFF